MKPDTRNSYNQLKAVEYPTILLQQFDTSGNVGFHSSKEATPKTLKNRTFKKWLEEIHGIVLNIQNCRGIALLKGDMRYSKRPGLNSQIKTVPAPSFLVAIF